MPPKPDDILRLYADRPRIERLLLRTRFASIPVEALEDGIPSDAVVVELGCGQGVLANILKEAQPARQIRGSDLSERRIRVARSTIQGRSGLQFEVGDITRREDVVRLRGEAPAAHLVISEVLYLLPETVARNVLQTLRDVMSPADVLWISDFTTTPWRKYAWLRVQNCLLSLAVNVAGRLAKGSLTGAFGARSALARIETPQAWQALLTGAGFLARRVPIQTRTPFPKILLRCTVSASDPRP